MFITTPLKKIDLAFSFLVLCLTALTILPLLPQVFEVKQKQEFFEPEETPQEYCEVEVKENEFEITEQMSMSGPVFTHSVLNPSCRS